MVVDEEVVIADDDDEEVVEEEDEDKNDEIELDEVVLGILVEADDWGELVVESVEEIIK